MSTQYRNAIVLVLDYLHANMLGAHGNTWVETPNFDRLAGESLVFEQAIADSVDLANAYDSLWQNSDTNLIRRLSENGIATHLLADELRVTKHEIAEDFEKATFVEANQSGMNGSLAESIGQTELAHFFAHASDWISQMERGCLGWFHSRGLGGAWDAPYPLRLKLAHPDDPEPPEIHVPPARVFGADDDPDELLGYQQACAAQIVLVDEFLGVLLDVMESDSRLDSTLLCVTSSRGFPMGEHGLVGTGDSTARPGQRLHNESVHLPLLVRLPKSEQFVDFQSTRVGNIVQPNWLTKFLETWFVEGDQAIKDHLESLVFSFPDPQTEWAVTRTESASAIQTHAWKLIQDSSLSPINYQLYAKPDDVWETNDVSRRCPQIVQQLSELLERVVGGDIDVGGDFELPDELAIRID